MYEFVFTICLYILVLLLIGYLHLKLRHVETDLEHLQAEMSKMHEEASEMSEISECVHAICEVPDESGDSVGKSVSWKDANYPDSGSDGGSEHSQESEMVGAVYQKSDNTDSGSDEGSEHHDTELEVETIDLTDNQ